MTIVTRFAPSPTGHLHIGGARTAIFCWLLARSQGGSFKLRIEDTDRKRSSQEMTDAILASMQWLGLDWDGEPIYQSEREELYNAAIDRLLDEGKAYWCSCTPEQVEAMREKARAEGKKPKYDYSCREKGLEAGENMVVRFKGPLDGKTVYDDMVLGTVAVDNQEMDDMILRRPDGSPTYNLAVVVDDNAMGVTHVLRGDDHVNNTPRQILLYRALGFDEPKFGHVPLIHGQDKKKLSKRHGAKSVMEYEKAGYLPEALVNYLVRLGWAFGDEEIFSRADLLEKFTTDNFSKSPAAFDPDKLDWLNSQYIQNSAPVALVKPLARFLADLGRTGLDEKLLTAIIPHYQPRAKTMVEMAEGSEFFVIPDAELEYDEKAVKKFLKPEVKEHLAAVREMVAAGDGIDPAGLEQQVKDYLDERELKFKVVAQPIRVAITGRTFSPGLFETMEVLGKDSTLARMDRALTLIG